MASSSSFPSVLPPPRPVPVTPSETEWRAMTPQQREQFIIDVNEALSDPVIAMSEGRPHKKAKSKALDMLGLHFRTLGKHIYLAEELSVMYPGVSGFTPDVMAVLDVEEPEDDQRMAWVVADEGKGLDWVLEVLWAGDRKKDLVDNVEKYAILGIPEYFVYDQKQQRIWGYRLPVGGKRYQPILAQAGLYRSNVLGIDLAIVGPRLKFFHGAAELYDTEHLIERLETMVAHLQEQAANALLREANAMQRETDAMQREANASQKAEKSLLGIRRSLMRVLVARNISCSRSTMARIEACTEPELLNEWLDRAFDSTTEEEIFATNA